MKKTKYYFNTHNLRYEQVEISWFRRFLRILGFLSSAAVFAIIIVMLAYTYLDSPKEKQLKREISQLKLQYEVMNEKLGQVNQVLATLQEKDDNIYRVIFEAEPYPASVRNAGYGGVNRFKNLENFDNSDVMINTGKKLEKIRRQLYVQSKSYDDISKMIKNKEAMLASLPAIQPVANKDLKRMASGFGYRIDPIYKTRKMHEGMDFTAPVGTDIYSTGMGVVASVEYGNRGYGNHVVINHGYGYRTLYGHMSKVLVKPGQKVNRGDKIGLVGNTGKSTGPHLHYEVHKSGHVVNPINYFYNDLTPQQYNQLLDMADRHNQSFD